MQSHRNGSSIPSKKQARKGRRWPTPEEIFDALGGYESTGGYMCPCPAHDDQNPSLSVGLGDDDKTLVHCFAGCDSEDVVEQLREQGLFAGGDVEDGTNDVEDSVEETVPSPSLSPPKQRPAGLLSGIPLTWTRRRDKVTGTLSAFWSYHDSKDVIIGQAARYDYADGDKDVVPFFIQQGKQWSSGIEAPSPLYNLHKLAQNPDAPVIHCEGEKAADAAGRLLPDYVPISTQGGASSVGKADYSPLAGRDIVGWRDNDKPGADYMRAAAEHALAAGANSYRFLDIQALATIAPEMAKPKSDAADWPVGVPFPADLPVVHTVDETIAVEEWPTPKPLSSMGVEDIPEELIPEGLWRDWVNAIATKHSIQRCVPAIVSLMGLLALCRGRIRIRPKAPEDWRIHMNVWGLLVADSGFGKSPALEDALGPFLIMGEETRDRASRELADVERKVYRLKHEEKEATQHGDTDTAADIHTAIKKLVKYRGPTLNTADSTVEALALLQESNPSGITVYRDELRGLFETWTRDSAGGTRQYYLEGWKGAKFSMQMDRVGRERTVVKGGALSVFGGIQQHVARSLVSESTADGSPKNDGLLQRFQLVVVPQKAYYEFRIDTGDTTKKIMKVFREVDAWLPTERFDDSTGEVSFQPETLEFPFKSEVQNEFGEWMTWLHNTVIANEPNPAIRGHLSKYPELVVKLTFAFELIARQGRRVTEITLPSFNLAAEWVDYLLLHARYLYSLPDTEASHEEVLADKIRDGSVEDGVHIRDLVRRNILGRGTKTATLRGALDVLENYNWVRVDNGRVVRINPALSVQPEDNSVGRPSASKVVSFGAYRRAKKGLPATHGEQQNTQKTGATPQAANLPAANDDRDSDEEQKVLALPPELIAGTEAKRRPVQQDDASDDAVDGDGEGGRPDIIDDLFTDYLQEQEAVGTNVSPSAEVLERTQPEDTTTYYGVLGTEPPADADDDWNPRALNWGALPDNEGD